MRANYEMKRAAQIGAICIVTYTVSYFFRNILSVFTPQMLASTLFTKENIALLSSVYMIAYAGGQLVNGVLGDHFKSKYMVLIGLCISGLGLMCFPLISANALQIGCFALLGFGLSMLRGPMVKIISENSLPQYARISCSLLSMSASAGPLIASFVSIYFQWNTIFIVAAILSFVFAGVSFIVFTLLERKGMIVPLHNNRENKQGLDILGVFRLPNFLRFLLLGAITEISFTSIGFWIPTYLSEQLQFSAATSGVLYSGMSLVRSFAPFLCLILLGLFHDNCVKMMRSMFIISAALLLLMLPIKMVWPNAILFTVSCVTASIASAALWSVYIPSLGKSGKVSSANGVLDCAGYIGAACANIMFAWLITNWGWNATIAVWAFVFVIGVGITVFPSKASATESC